MRLHWVLSLPFPCLTRTWATAKQVAISKWQRFFKMCVPSYALRRIICWADTCSLLGNATYSISLMHADSKTVPVFKQSWSYLIWQVIGTLAKGLAAVTSSSAPDVQKAPRYKHAAEPQALWSSYLPPIVPPLPVSLQRTCKTSRYLVFKANFSRNLPQSTTTGDKHETWIQRQECFCSQFSLWSLSLC